ncbi:hypothetical protein TIFTF001_012610 [Ficus carica]|uniref:GH16 domain-containing protein n=1 Tax=Ficus carica TaxID=3494 RepID=A0AA88DI39_FICCA|nr:hypothetical protein TIFTF001_012610 [Ficus carica]
MNSKFIENKGFLSSGTSAAITTVASEGDQRFGGIERDGVEWAALAGDLRQEFDLVFGDQRAKILDEGRLLTLSLDQASGSGFTSKKEYLFARIDMQLMLVAGDSAGTVTAYYNWCPIPKQAANEALLNHLECGPMGNKRRAREDQLVQVTFHRLLPELQGRRLHPVGNLSMHLESKNRHAEPSLADSRARPGKP